MQVICISEACVCVISKLSRVPISLADPQAWIVSIQPTRSSPAAQKGLRRKRTLTSLPWMLPRPSLGARASERCRLLRTPEETGSREQRGRQLRVPTCNWTVRGLFGSFGAEGRQEIQWPHILVGRCSGLFQRGVTFVKVLAQNHFAVLPVFCRFLFLS